MADVVSPGTRLGRYEIVSLLGSGGMGEVHRARDLQLGRSVAIKVIRSTRGAESDERRRFRREAEIASRLTHPHVCTLFDVGAEGDLDYLVLELLEGESLADRLHRGTLSAPEALRIATEVADALAFAHGLGFVHRDLKPANVFLTAAGAKLLDFGLARAAEAAADSGSDSKAPTAEAPLTELGAICGTPPYMSPEQAAGRQVDERSDQFSLGSVLFEMLTGRRAFAGASTVETLSAVMRDDPLTGPAARDVPPAFRNVLERLLAKEPADRFASTRAAAEALRALGRDPSTPSTITVAASRRSSLRLAIAAGVLVIAAAGAVLALRATRLARPSFDSVAILPFAARGGDPDGALLADGVTESLVNTLAELPSLRVMALASVKAYRGREPDPREVGRALGVRAVVTGHLEPAGRNTRVGVALVDARDGSHLWGTSLERPPQELVLLESQLAADLGRELTRRLTGAQAVRLARPSTEDHEAYLLFLKGRYFWAKRDRESLLKGVELFRRALDRDPTYARAWTGLAESYDVLTFMRYMAPRETFPRADEAARRATELDPSLGDGWAVLAHVTMLWKRDLAEAESQFKRAIELTPSSFNAHHWYAHLLMSAGRWSEAERESRTALEVDPLSLVASVHMGELLFSRGDVQGAIAQYRKTLEMDRGFGIAHSFLGSALVSSGRYEEALSELREAARLLPDSTDVLGQLGSALARSGRRAEAEAVLETLTRMRSRVYVSGLPVALVAASLGLEDRAAEEIGRALEDGDVGTASLVGTDPRFTGLRQNPRFKPLLDRLDASASRAH